MYTTIQTKIASLKIFPGQVLYTLQIVQYIFSYFPNTFFNMIFFKKEKTPELHYVLILEVRFRSVCRKIVISLL